MNTSHTRLVHTSQQLLQSSMHMHRSSYFQYTYNEQLVQYGLEACACARSTPSINPASRRRLHHTPRTSCGVTQLSQLDCMHTTSQYQYQYQYQSSTRSTNTLASYQLVCIASTRVVVCILLLASTVLASSMHTSL